MKVLKWFAEQLANNIVTLGFGVIVGGPVIYVAIVLDYIQIVWSWFTTPAQLSIGFVVVSLILMTACVVQSVRARRRVSQPPFWKNYQEDEFAGAIWRWDYLDDNTISDLRPYCKACDCALSLHFNYFAESIVYRCVSCNSEVGGFPRRTTLSDALATIHKLIDQRIRQRYHNNKKATS